MNVNADERHGQFVAAIQAIARARLDPAQAEPACAFIAELYDRLPVGDLAAAAAEDRYSAALSLFSLMAQHRPGTALVRARNPAGPEQDWACPHTVIEIVHDDMPFLVDSVSGAIGAREAMIHLLAHPVIADAAGQRRSVMHIEIDRQPGGQALASLAAEIEAVLADVRAAVGDWRPMHAAIANARHDLQDGAGQLAPGELEEAGDFLAWLAANNFTFLGYRRYRYAEMGAIYELVPGSGLGLLRDPAVMIYDNVGPGGALPEEVRQFVASSRALMVTKADRIATVHRRAPMDCVSVKIFAADGRVEGEHRLVGLFTSAAYNLSPVSIPLLRRKVGGVIARAGLDPDSHDGKALLNILETYPRDELFQSAEPELLDTALGIVALQERWRTALFVRRDALGRFVSCLIYAPRERYDSALRRRFEAILTEAFDGRIAGFATWIGDQSVLARVLFTVRLKGPMRDFDVAAIEARLVEATRSWSDRLREALVQAQGEARAIATARRYEGAFPTAYQEAVEPRAAVGDVGRIDEALAYKRLKIAPYRRPEQPNHAIALKLFSPGGPIPLSDVLPLLEAMGLRVITDIPYSVRPMPADGGADLGPGRGLVYIHDLELETQNRVAVELDHVRAIFRIALQRVWTGAMESDGFNRLVLGAHLGWREVSLLRAICKYLRQAGIPFSQDYMERALNEHSVVARLLVGRFAAQFDPDRQQGTAEAIAAIDGQIDIALDAVTSLDQDRILRRFRNAIASMLRTNFYQTGADGWPKPWISFKLDSRKVEDLPLPRPMVEVWVYSPRTEAIHLRGGKVARGGIRWSDRREDFRTEILGLMKAQMVKNAVIVPVGSKGGFVVKRPPPPSGGPVAEREALMGEVVECYKTLMRGLLDITDNLSGGAVVAPPRVVRLDGDDPYLVVAADKGTATFSDIANGVARDYGFWLDDAFASGGSAGYDHKKMAITARGAWECVKRHFRELAIDTQATPFTVIGVGDMSGDVFGNGMLRSPYIRLLAAFDHRHIFIDPNPDPARSLVERQRLFELPRSSWADYDLGLISEGGGVFERGAKSVPLSAAMKALLELTIDHATPAEIIKAILRAKADLLWFGGIGTYVKAAAETAADAGDRANDALRIDGREIRARVVGEGANLGVTQRGRVEAAMAGVKINTDALDNSAGVDCSDHEVNIKVALGDAMAQGGLSLEQRDEILASMTGDVAALVLRDNYQQSQAVSVAEARAVPALPLHARFMRNLELAGKLDRAVEFLPGRDGLAQRQAAGRGLTRPELCVLLAYAKIALNEELLASDLPDDPLLQGELHRYFPPLLQQRFAPALDRHRLRREIIATQVVNSMINRVGPAFVDDLRERTGASGPAIARAFALARDVFGLRPLWAEIEALDGMLVAPAQTAMLLATQRLLERASLWFLRKLAPGFDAMKAAQRFAAPIAALAQHLPAGLPAADRAEFDARAQALAGQGAPAMLAARVAALEPLASAGDIAQLAERGGQAVPEVASAYFAVGARFEINTLRAMATRLPVETQWQALAVNASSEELAGLQAALTASVLAHGSGLDGWCAARADAVARYARLTSDLKGAAPDLAMLTVAGRELRALVG